MGSPHGGVFMTTGRGQGRYGFTQHKLCVVHLSAAMPSNRLEDPPPRTPLSGLPFAS